MLINLRNALMSGKRLPYDAEVEYLESTGTQWIDTGVKKTSGITIDCTFSLAATNTKAVFGGRTGAANSDRLALFAFNSNFRFDAGDQKYLYTPDTTSKFRFQYDGTNAILTNLTTGVVDTQAVGIGDAGTVNIVLFGVSTNGEISAKLEGRIYSFKLWQNGTLVRDYIPVRKGTTGYLYDRVSGKLFGNAGTGDFVLGPDVVPVEYLQSTGTQWIDTGTPTADKYIFECLFTDATADIKLFGNSYAYGRYRDLAIYQSRYRGTSIATSSNAWDRIEIDVAQPRLTVTRSGSTVGSATGWWSAYTGATPDTQYGTALPFGGHVNAYGSWYGTNRVTCFYAAQGVRLRTRLFESWLGSELIEKLLPVRVGTGSAWEGAMIDTLTRRIYRNAGAGAFTYGNDLKYPIPAE